MLRSKLKKMTTKLDTPKNKGELTYSNTGSSARLINYQISNKEKLGDENEFFTLSKERISPEDAKKMIDNNVKGLKAADEKFYSFSINPSDDELKHIGNDKNKLKEYTRKVMSNYADNFKEKGLKPTDIVWTAIIHDTRYYTHEDVSRAKQAKEPINFKAGDIKPGNNMHVHIIVSRKNSDMKQTLTIRGRKGKTNFSLFEFQKNNQNSFQDQFKYRVGENLYGEMQTQSILKELKKFNTKMPLNDQEVLKIANKHNFSGNINYNIKDLHKSINRGQAIDDPYRFIEIGKKDYFKELKESKELKDDIKQGFSDLLTVLSSGNSMEKNKGEIPDISDYYRKRKKKKLII